MKIMSKNNEHCKIDDQRFFSIYKEIEEGRSLRKDIIAFVSMGAIMAFVYFMYF